LENDDGLLTDAGFWDEESAWRFYGDTENNYSTFGNQQSRPEAALVEKLINAVDALLMGECLSRGIDPEGPEAPRSPLEAVARFFEDVPKAEGAGFISEWTERKRTEIAKKITLAATGNKPNIGAPCYSIADQGEGQTPSAVPETLLSLARSNKLRIPFVQGKFNMGGTGVLQFCGALNLQLIVTKRHPKIAKLSDDPDKDKWSFTVVRRESPAEGRRSSVFTYLAPIGCVSNPRAGQVLRFAANSLKIFPRENDPYSRSAEWGTLIKLYEYTLRKSHILRKGGLLNPLEILIPNPAVPIRLHECRPYGGHSGSFANNLVGLKVRLTSARSDNLEHGFPYTCSMMVSGESLTAKVFAFKKNKAGTYRGNEGVIFTIQGQTHGTFSTSFFRRKSVGLSYIHDSVLVIVDCTNFSGRNREDLFMNSRDRLRRGPLYNSLENILEYVLKNSEPLRNLKDRRRAEAIAEKVGDSRPLQETLKSILEKSPSLSRLFLQGKQLTNPFRPKHVKYGVSKFEGVRFPTFFKFKAIDYGKLLKRDCNINVRSRLTFETDAENSYFDREVDKGEAKIFIVLNNSLQPVSDYSLNLYNGIATLNMRLPNDCKVGDEINYLCQVTDRTRIEPFKNFFRIKVIKENIPRRNQGKRRNPPSKEKGRDRESPTGIQLPKVTRVREEYWGRQSPPFDQYTALVIKNVGDEDREDSYDFYINIDNIYLKSEQKTSKEDSEILLTRFETGMVLLGLGLLNNYASKTQTNESIDEFDSEIDIEKDVEQVTKAVAPILLPMIESLGDLTAEEI